MVMKGGSGSGKEESNDEGGDESDEEDRGRMGVGGCTEEDNGDSARDHSRQPGRIQHQ